jgi:hypothetical protein
VLGEQLRPHHKEDIFMPTAPDYMGGGDASLADYGRGFGGLGGGLGSALGGIFGGLFGKNPYKNASKEYERYANQAAGYQNPFFQAGTGALGDFQNYLKGMKDPSEFLNNLMKNYKESDYTKNLKSSAERSGINAASASGLIGSTPFLKQSQKNAGEIESAGMNDWLSNALGINKQYGSGLEDLIRGGQGAGNNLSNIFSQLGENKAGTSYGSDMARNKQMQDFFSGLMRLFGSFSGMGG